jgi:hypothetical protein
MQRRQGLLGCAAIFATVFIVATRCSMVAPPFLIERNLLVSTPIGSSKEFVKSSLQRHSARIEEDTSVRGYESLQYPVSGVRNVDSFVRVHVARYQIPMFDVTVVGFYLFDRDERLIKVVVRKYVDSL